MTMGGFPNALVYTHCLFVSWWSGLLRLVSVPSLTRCDIPIVNRLFWQFSHQWTNKVGINKNVWKTAHRYETSCNANDCTASFITKGVFQTLLFSRFVCSYLDWSPTIPRLNTKLCKEVPSRYPVSTRLDKCIEEATIWTNKVAK